MPSEKPQRRSRLGVCLCVRHLDGTEVETHLYETVLDAVEDAMDRLRDREDLTAVVVLGEAIGVDELHNNLKIHATALAEALGQAGLFVTLAAQDVVRDRLMSDVRFENFGIYSAEALDRADRIFAVIHPDLYEPVVPQKKVTGNCPRLPRSFVGRRVEFDELQNLILDRSLVTIIGPPGVGKTALGIHVAPIFGDEYEDGVWWFSLDKHGTFVEVLDEIGATKGLLNLKGRITQDRVVEGLKEKNCLIVLDGCERMAQEVGQFCTAILRDAKSVSLLTTATRSLGIDGEFLFRLKPMRLPQVEDSGEDALIESDALELFYERASQSGERLPLDVATVETVGRICRLVDGLPIAIELVASSIRTESLSKVLKSLESGSGYRRPDGLDQALELSYKSLDEGYRLLLSHLALFRAEWRIQSVVELWPEKFQTEGVTRLHDVLTEFSWITYQAETDSYSMLNMVKSFCWSRAGEDRDILLTEFCKRLCGLAKTLIQPLLAPDAPEGKTEFSRHYPDFRFALETCIERKHVECASALVASLVHPWLKYNMVEDALKFCPRYLKLGVTGVEAARGYVMIGVAHLRLRNVREGKEASERCYAIGKELGNLIIQERALSNISILLTESNFFEEARPYANDAVEISRKLENEDSLCVSLVNAADVEFRDVAMRRLVGDQAHSLEEQVLLQRAESFLDEAAPFLDEVTPWTLQAYYLSMGSLHFYRDQFTAAEISFNKGIALCVKHGMTHEAPQALEYLAEIQLIRGSGSTAARLIGLSKRIREEYGEKSTEFEAQLYGNLASRLLKIIDKDRLAKWMDYGARLDLAETLTSTIFNV